MALVTIITMLALVEYIFFGMQVGLARGKYNVVAPATTGHPQFERVNRIHLNTLEQLVVFIPGLWAFGYFVSFTWGAVLGAVYLVGRIVYSVSYSKDPDSRGIGVLLSVLPSYVMVLGALAGAAWAVLQG